MFKRNKKYIKNQKNKIEKAENKIWTPSPSQLIVISGLQISLQASIELSSTLHTNYFPASEVGSKTTLSFTSTSWSDFP
jgi:hypothetical protein